MANKDTESIIEIASAISGIVNSDRELKRKIAGMVGVIGAIIEIPWVTPQNKGVAEKLSARGHLLQGVDSTVKAVADPSKTSFEMARAMLLDNPGKYSYFEGLYSDNSCVELGLRAWLMNNETGLVVDPLNNSNDSIYFGIAMNPEYVARMENKVGVTPLIFDIDEQDMLVALRSHESMLAAYAIEDAAQVVNFQINGPHAANFIESSRVIGGTTEHGMGGPGAS